MTWVCVDGTGLCLAQSHDSYVGLYTAPTQPGIQSDVSRRDWQHPLGACKSLDLHHSRCSDARCPVCVVILKILYVPAIYGMLDPALLCCIDIDIRSRCHPPDIPCGRDAAVWHGIFAEYSVIAIRARMPAATLGARAEAIEHLGLVITITSSPIRGSILCCQRLRAVAVTTDYAVMIDPIK